MNKVEKIKAYLERRIAEIRDISQGYIADKQMSTEYLLLFELLSYIDSLEEETTDSDLEDEITRCIVDEDMNFSDVAHHFAQWKEKQLTKNSISMDIDSETEWDDIHKFLRKNLDGEKIKLLILNCQN